MGKYKEKDYLNMKGDVYYVTRTYKYDVLHEESLHKDLSRDEWKKLMLDTTQNVINTGEVEFLAGIFHDRDEAVDKNKKKIIDEVTKKPVLVELHYHVLVKFKRSMKQPDVKHEFGATNDQSCQVPDRPLGMARYLVHRSEEAMNEKKVKYNDDEVMFWSDGGKLTYDDVISSDFWGVKIDYTKGKSSKMKVVVDEKDGFVIYDGLTDAKNNDYVQGIVAGIGEKLSNGEIRKNEALNMLEKYTNHGWVRKYGYSFDRDIEIYIDRKVKHLKANGRQLKNIYISGYGGIGKTTFGEGLATYFANGDADNMHVGSTQGKGKTFDALDSYTGEKALVLNEMSSMSFDLNEFKDVFDKATFAPFPSRFDNKSFVGDTVVFTSSITPLRFAKDVVIYSGGGSQYQDPANKRELDLNNEQAVNQYWQVKRRLEYSLIMIRDEDDYNYVNVHVFKLRESMRLADGSIDNENGEHILVGVVKFESKPEHKPNITIEHYQQAETLMNTDVKGCYDDVVTLDKFLEKHNLVDSVDNSIINSFIADVVDNCVWDLLPSEFLYDIYKSYINKYYPEEKLLNISEFVQALSDNLDGWERKDYSVHVGSKMVEDEPLITEYLDDNVKRFGKKYKWINYDYSGGNEEMKRDFRRQKSYKGFVRK